MDNLHDFVHYNEVYKERARLIKHQPGWWENLEPIKENMDLVREAEAIGFDIQILTKGPRSNSNAWAEKVRWVNKHLGPDYPVHIVSDKSLAYGKVLFDDWPSYCEAWLTYRKRGIVLMPEMDYNMDFEHPQVIKVNRKDHYEDRIDLLKRVYDKVRCYE